VKRALTTLLMFSVLAIAVTMLPRMALAQSELLGTWKLNVEKSKFNPGPAPKNSVLTYEAAGEATKVTNGSRRDAYWPADQPEQYDIGGSGA
jgi:hypothetical protein